MSLALITGSTGLVGSETAIFLLKKGFEVIGIDNNERVKLFGKDGDTSRIKRRLKKTSKFYKHYDIDITNRSKLEKIFKKYKNRFSFILHAAAQPSHDWAKTNITKDFSINDHTALIEKMAAEEVFKELLDDDKIANLARYFVTLPSEVAMKCWTIMGDGEIQNTIRLHQSDVDGSSVSSFLVELLTGDNAE